MIPFVFDSSEAQPEDAADAASALHSVSPNAPPAVPPLNLQAIEESYLARQDAAKARSVLEGLGGGLLSTTEMAALGSGAALAFSPLLLLIGLWSGLSPALMALSLPCALLLLTVSAKALSQSCRLEAAHTALALTEANSSWIVPCIASLQVTRGRQREVAANLLIRLLPTPAPEFLLSLSALQRHRLYNALSFALYSHPEFALAALHAIEKSEDAAAAPYLERVIPRFAVTAKTRQVRQAAIRCGEALEAAEARERARLEALNGNPGPDTVSKMTPAERAEAARTQNLLSQMENESRRRRRPGMRVGFLAATWLIILPYCLAQFLSNAGPQWWLNSAALFWGAATLLSVQSHRLTLFGRQSETARELAECDSLLAVGPLAEALEWPDAQIQRVASDALIRLLPRLKASDASLLNPKQRNVLYKTLRPLNANQQSKLICAILAALEQVGDKAALPAVSRLEAMLAITTAQRSVRAAAKRCLPCLSANAENARSSQTLLRASSALTTTPDMLLRPAALGQETPQDQLLRASAPGAENES